MPPKRKITWPKCDCGVLVRVREDPAGIDVHVEFGEFRRFGFIPEGAASPGVEMGRVISEMIRDFRVEISEEYAEWHSLMEAG